MSLDATVGGASSNSYVTRAEADTYFADRLYAANWTSADNTHKDQALITATLRIDQEQYEGGRVTTTQVLNWPRAGVELKDPIGWVYYGGGTWGIYYPIDSIPKPIKDAVCEYALLLLGSDSLAQSDLSNFKSLKIGPLELEMNQPVRSGILPSQVARLLKGLRVASNGIVRA